MPQNSSRHAKIVSTGLYHPDKLVPNSYFDELYGKDISTFLKEKRNIHQRYFMSEEQATSDLILPAAQKALSKAEITAQDLDLIIVASDTPDYLSPATASVVQHKLGAKNAGTFDVNAACAGFVTAVDIANKYISADSHYKNILVVGAYGMSKYLDMDDYKIASLFADGAGAVVMQPTEQADEGVLASYLWADGSYNQAMGIYAGGTAQPVHHDVLQSREHLLKFKAKIPPEFNAHHWPRVANNVLDQARHSVQDVKHFFLTQINIDSIHQCLDNLKVPRERSHNVMDKFGYTGSACIPMAMADADEHGALEPGDLVLLIGSGGGVAMGGILLKWA